MRQRSPWRAYPVGQKLESVSHSQLISKQRANVEDPCCRGDVLPGHLGRNLIIDAEDGEDFKRRYAVKNDNEDDGEDEVKCGTLIQSCRASAASRGGLIHRFPPLSQQWVEYQKARHDRKVASERIVLRIGVVDFSPRNPPIGEVPFILGISGVRSCPDCQRLAHRISVVGFGVPYASRHHRLSRTCTGPRR